MDEREIESYHAWRSKRDREEERVAEPLVTETDRFRYQVNPTSTKDGHKQSKATEQIGIISILPESPSVLSSCLTRDRRAAPR